MDEGVLLKLVSFGDELIAGKNSAAYFLAEKLGLDFENCAQSDICNNQIFRQVIEFVVKNNNCFVLIGWTKHNRLEINWKNQTFTYRQDKNEYIDNGLNSLHRFDDILFNKLLKTQHWASEAFTLQQVLKYHNIQYYMYNTQDCMFYNDTISGTIEQLDVTKYHNPTNLQSSMLYFLEKEGYNELTCDAHKSYSEFLYGKIKAGKLI